jgi:hypothetical protein
MLVLTPWLTTVALSAPSANTNQCWGDIASQLGQAGAMGPHSAASSPFTPTPEDPRRGVANQSRFLEDIGVISTGEPGQGGNGLHAIANGGLIGSVPGGLPSNTGDPLTANLICDGTPGNPPPVLP